MKKSRFSDSQIMKVLKRADAGIKVPDLCRVNWSGPIQIMKFRPVGVGLNFPW